MGNTLPVGGEGEYVKPKGIASTGRALASVSVTPATPVVAAQTPPDTGAPPSVLLRENWTIRSSVDVRETGATLSVPGLDVRDWYPATVLITVLSALLQAHVYLDPYFGMNLRTIPSTHHPIYGEFANIMMPPGSPFRHSWWYRTEFKMPASYAGHRRWLCFDGINYRANAWVKGHQIGSSDKCAGMWRLFQFDVTSDTKPGETNVLAAEIFPPQPRDLAMTFVDWAPLPPDKEMGLWREVAIGTTVRRVTGFRESFPGGACSNARA